VVRTDRARAARSRPRLGRVAGPGGSPRQPGTRTGPRTTVHPGATRSPVAWRSCPPRSRSRPRRVPRESRHRHW